ncbi:MAG: DUF4416 family protein [Elusimicrobiota bacterium]|nr:DUF4416 family protein [Elusimicrobiota bacterium]
MGEIKKVQPVKLILGEIYKTLEIKNLAEEELSRRYGKIDLCSGTIPFDTTDYYCEEMGKSLYRSWISFEKLIMPDELSEIKLKTNELEKNFSQEQKRQINLDPGYITSTSLILASTKNCSRRIYLKNGIYAELTLIYEHKGWQNLKWTYPDYQKEVAKNFFTKVRKKYLLQVSLTSSETSLPSSKFFG